MKSVSLSRFREEFEQECCKACKCSKCGRASNSLEESTESGVALAGDITRSSMWVSGSALAGSCKNEEVACLGGSLTNDNCKTSVSESRDRKVSNDGPDDHP